MRGEAHEAVQVGDGEQPQPSRATHGGESAPGHVIAEPADRALRVGGGLLVRERKPQLDPVPKTEPRLRGRTVLLWCRLLRRLALAFVAIRLDLGVTDAPVRRGRRAGALGLGYGAGPAMLFMAFPKAYATGGSATAPCSGGG